MSLISLLMRVTFQAMTLGYFWVMVKSVTKLLFSIIMTTWCSVNSMGGNYCLHGWKL